LLQQIHNVHNCVFFNYSQLYLNLTFFFFFKQDYSKLHRVEVIVTASLHVDSTAKNTVVHAESQLRLTVFPERRADKYGGGVPWWIIVLSILFGLMLLALLAFLLWKCGLFGKKNKEHPSEKERLTANA
ncbi:integrin alpha-6-like, partial [Plectropomus leopardus]|uniref:integrin alpha-6-like n=1 Tax=Plectropomus leopardus TaxID=160734 RepID=UPI001C4BA1DB